MKQDLPKNIDEYISLCPFEIQPLLHEMRKTIHEAAPMAEEKISWGMATFTYLGNLVHFSAEKKHIGFHPTPSAIITFEQELAPYHCTKGTVQFPYDKPVPFELVSKMTAFRVKEQESLHEAKLAGKKTERPSRPRYPIPDDIVEIMDKEGLTERYQARPPYQQNDYIGWITRAKRPETRRKRLTQMLDELRSGNAYMGMEYNAKK